MVRSAEGAVSSPPLDVEALYRRYSPMVLGRCRMLLGDDVEAQDACQDIFVKLHRSRARFRGEAHPTTYLFKITTTTCLNRLRSRRRRRDRGVEELPEPPDHHEPSTPSPLRRAELRQLVDRVLAGQSARTQACAIYHYADGMTHAEVGELLGLSAAAVRKRLGKLRRSFRDDPPAWWDKESP